ncbi:MAG: hypothetical protein AAGM38_06850 [Pseudomonadota bacterium]
MPDDTPKKPPQRFSVDYLIWRIASLDHKEVSEEEVAYFRANPDQIDEVSSPLTLHKLFLWIGLAVGVILVGLSKTLSHSGVFSFMHAGVEAFIVEVVFEIGVALIGAAIVTFMIGIALNQQQASAKRWRKEIRKRIKER